MHVCAIFFFFKEHLLLVILTFYAFCIAFIDDCVNIISIMNHLAQKDCIFEATNKLVQI